MSIHGLVDTTWYNPIIMVIVSCFFPFLFERKRVEYINLNSESIS